MSIKLGNRVVSGNNAVHKANKTLDNITQKGEENIVKSLYNANVSMGSNKLILANNLFDIKMTDHLLSGSEAAGWKLAGSRVYKSDYPSFYERCVKEYSESTADYEYVSLGSDITFLGSINNNRGLLTNFISGTNAAVINKLPPSSITSFEFRAKVVAPASHPQYKVIFGQGGSKNKVTPQIEIGTAGYLQASCSGTGTDWDYVLRDVETAVGKTFWLKVTWLDGVFSLFKSWDNITYNLACEPLTMPQVKFTDTVGVGGDDCGDTINHAFEDGIIDLNECYININGERWWTGTNKVDTLAHNNGHVYYSIDKSDDIEKIYNTFGYADYYGVNTDSEYIILPRPQEAEGRFTYYCVGNAEIGEQTIDVSAEYQLNNPFFFGMNKYFKKTPNNLSWLKSNGEFHTRAMYPGFYDWAVEQHTNGVDGFVLNTDTYDDYALVINKEDETFRLPLLNGEEDVLGDEFEDIPFTTSTAVTTIPSTPKRRAFFLAQGTMTNDCYVQTLSREPDFYNHAYHYSYTGSTSLRILHPHVFKPNVEVTIGYKNVKLTYLRWYYAVGNGDLYYYVGETVNDAQVIDVARLTSHINENAIFKDSEILDGEWVDTAYTIASNVSISTSSVSYDISEALPEDDYDYEVLFSGLATTSASSGAYVNVYVSTDIISKSVGVTGCRTRSSSNVTAVGSTTLPVGTGRKVIVSANTSGNGTYQLHIYGYRRLGKRRK